MPAEEGAGCPIWPNCAISFHELRIRLLFVVISDYLKESPNCSKEDFNFASLSDISCVSVDVRVKR